MQKLACSLQFLHFYLSKENATPQKAEMNRGYEGVPPLPTLLSSSQPALGQKRCPCRSCCPQTKRPSGSFPNTRLLTRPSVPLRDADGEPRSRRLHSQFLPPQGPFPPEGRQLSATDAGRDRRDASCLPRVTQPRPGWRWQPPVPPLPGLNPRCATRPRRHHLRR